MIAAGRAFLMRGHTAEFGAPNNEGVLQHAALFEIGQEGGGRLIEDGAMALVVGFESLVGVPVQQAIDGAGSRGAVETDVADAFFEKAAREEAIARVFSFEFVCVVRAVKLVNIGGLFGEIADIWRGELHLRGEFVSRHARAEFVVSGMRASMFAVDLLKEFARAASCSGVIDAGRSKLRRGCCAAIVTA